MTKYSGSNLCDILQLQDFLEGTFLTEQVDSAKELADYIAVLERMKTNPIGEFIFDQELFQEKR